jgi:hypothetical protein
MHRRHRRLRQPRVLPQQPLDVVRVEPAVPTLVQPHRADPAPGLPPAQRLRMHTKQPSRSRRHQQPAHVKKPKPDSPSCKATHRSCCTLMGHDNKPGELSGYGPVTADVARALATGGIWRRLVTDPLSEAVLDVGRTRYRPPPDLAKHVIARDQVCARPGCSTRAESCDLDHTIEFNRNTPGSPIGTTSAANLGPLCRRDHQIKTDAGFHLDQVSAGSFEWTTPTGHRYGVTPGADGRVLPLPLRRARTEQSGAGGIERPGGTEQLSGTEQSGGPGWPGAGGTGSSDGTG